MALNVVCMGGYYRLLGLSSGSPMYGDEWLARSGGDDGGSVSVGNTSEPARVCMEHEWIFTTNN